MLLHLNTSKGNQRGLGSLISYVLSVPLQPLEDMQPFSPFSLC